jgi:NAD(P)H dehydrogenase (quinone)
MTKIAIIYYSSTGHTYQLAQAVEEGARSLGAEVRLRKVQELAPEQAIASNQGWQQHVVATQHVQEAALEDLEWADGFVFGTPTRYGNVSAQLKQFIDSTGPLWGQGKLANKAVAAFAGAGNAHGGQESTLLALSNSFYHWGAVIVPTGYTDPVIYGAGGNPYGVSFTASQDGSGVGQEVLAAGRYLGQRVTRYAEVISQNLDRLLPMQEEAAQGAEAAGAEA